MIVTERLPALTSLRFFAAVAIVLHHIVGHAGLPAQIAFALPQGVSFFFVLSGFILTYNYPSLRTGLERKQFLIARFARLWPAYIVGIIATIAARPDAIVNLDRLLITRTLATNLTMIQTWVPLNGFTYSINGPSWSIATEFGLYFAFLLLINDFARTWWWKLGASLLIAAFLVAIATAFNMPWFGPDAYVDSAALLYLHPLGRLFEFVVGMCAGLAYRTWSFRIRGGPIGWTLLELAAVILVMAVSKASFLYPGSTPLGWWFGMGAMAIPAAVLTFVMAQGRGLVSGLLSLSPAVFLGEISYSIYLLHSPIAYLFFIKFPGRMPDGYTLAAFAAVTILASAATWVLIERPARTALRYALNAQLFSVTAFRRGVTLFLRRYLSQRVVVAPPRKPPVPVDP